MGVDFRLLRAEERRWGGVGLAKRQLERLLDRLRRAGAGGWRETGRAGGGKSGANRGQPARSCMHTRGADRHAARRGGTKGARIAPPLPSPPRLPACLPHCLSVSLSVPPTTPPRPRQKAKLSTPVSHDTVTRGRAERDAAPGGRKAEGKAGV